MQGYADLADWLGIESAKDVKNWIAGHTARADEITRNLARTKPVRRKKCGKNRP